MIKFEFEEIMLLQKNINYVLMGINQNIIIPLLKYKLYNMNDLNDIFYFENYTIRWNFIKIRTNTVIIDCFIKQCNVDNAVNNNSILHIDFKDYIIIKNTTIRIWPHSVIGSNILKIYLKENFIDNMYLFINDNNITYGHNRDLVKVELHLCGNSGPGIDFINHLE